MKFRNYGLSFSLILFTAVRNSRFPVFAEGDSSCDCSATCTPLVEQCNVKLDKANADNEKAVEQLKVWENKQGTYASLFARKEKDISALKSSLDEAETKVETCNTDLTETKNLSQNLQESLDGLQKIHSEFKTEAESEKNNFMTKNNDLSKTVEDLTEEIKNLGNKNEQLDKNLKEVEAEKASLAENNKEFSSNLQKAQQDIHELSISKNDLTDSKKQLEDNLSNLKQEMGQVAARNKELAASLEVAQNGLSELSDGKTELESVLQNLRIEIEQGNEKIEALNKERDELEGIRKKEITELNGKLKASEERASDLSKKNEDLAKELAEKNKDIDSLTDSYEGTKASLATTETDYNHAIQSLEDMKARFIRQDTLYTAEQNKLVEKIQQLDSEANTLNEQIQTLRREKMDARKEVSDLEKELQQMHRQATSTYVNRTLVLEDVSSYLDKLIDKVNAAGGKATEKTLERSNSAREKLNAVYEKVAKVSSPHAGKAKEMYMKHAHSRVKSTRDVLGNKYSERAAPIIGEYVVPLWEKHGVPVKNRVLEAFESTRLTMVSSLEVGSKTVVNYFVVSSDARNEMNPLVKRVVNNANRVNKNAEYIVNRFLTGVGSLLAIYLFGSFVISTIFMFVFMPYYIIKYLFISKKKKKTASKKSSSSPTATPNTSTVVVDGVSRTNAVISERPAQ